MIAGVIQFPCVRCNTPFETTLSPADRQLTRGLCPACRLPEPGVKKRRGPYRLFDRTCEHCQRGFKGTRRAKYCPGDSCRVMAWRDRKTAAGG